MEPKILDTKEGTYSKVHKIEIEGKIYAYKKKLCYSEYDILSSLDHPNIIKIEKKYEKGILMPYYEKDLFRDSANIAFSDLKNMIIQLLSAVEYIHKEGYIHGDIKPNNILLDGYTPILIDFGMARVIDRYDVANVFQAPEQIYDLGCSESIDIWCLGSTLYWVMTAESVVRHKRDKSPIEDIKEILSPDSESTKMLLKYPVIGKVVLSMLTLNPFSRPSASECLKMIQESK